MYKAEVADRDSARDREVEVKKSGKVDWLFNITGLVGLGAFGVIIYAIIALDIPEANKELLPHDRNHRGCSAQHIWVLFWYLYEG